jgi:ketosteroid isomerase-like protein
MKTLLAVTIIGFAIGFSLPTLAQEQNAVDPEVHQQIEAVLAKCGEAQNKHDAAAYAARYTQNAVRVFGWETGGGVASGQDAIEKRCAVDLASNPGEISGKLLQVYAVGNDVFAISKWSVAPWKGYAVFVFVREADEWKIRMEYADSLNVPE